eukprot:gb/GEZN01002804.1/.p1 GENE.gb/GEZN01002804.1/~~gb/GEZN01002804.1/.p1  ORF type:complete len:778 (+),score=116.88 gb/GEZN01002804.1/:117-2336(+)
MFNLGWQILALCGLVTGSLKDAAGKMTIYVMVVDIVQVFMLRRLVDWESLKLVLVAACCFIPMVAVGAKLLFIMDGTLLKHIFGAVMMAAALYRTYCYLYLTIPKEQQEPSVAESAIESTRRSRISRLRKESIHSGIHPASLHYSVSRDFSSPWHGSVSRLSLAGPPGYSARSQFKGLPHDLQVSLLDKDHMPLDHEDINHPKSLSQSLRNCEEEHRIRMAQDHDDAAYVATRASSDSNSSARSSASSERSKYSKTSDDTGVSISTDTVIASTSSQSGSRGAGSHQEGSIGSINEIMSSVSVAATRSSSTSSGEGSRLSASSTQLSHHQTNKKSNGALSSHRNEEDEEEEEATPGEEDEEAIQEGVDEDGEKTEIPPSPLTPASPRTPCNIKRHDSMPGPYHALNMENELGTTLDTRALSKLEGLRLSLSNLSNLRTNFHGGNAESLDGSCLESRLSDGGSKRHSHISDCASALSNLSEYDQSLEKHGLGIDLFDRRVLFHTCLAFSLSGLTGGLFFSTGPPLMIYVTYYSTRGLDMHRWRAAFSMIKAMGDVSRLVALSSAGLVFDDWSVYIILSVCALSGLTIANRLAQYVTKSQFEAMILVALSLSALTFLTAETNVQQFFLLSAAFLIVLVLLGKFLSWQARVLSRRCSDCKQDQVSTWGDSWCLWLSCCVAGCCRSELAASDGEVLQRDEACHVQQQQQEHGQKQEDALLIKDDGDSSPLTTTIAITVLRPSPS